MVTAILPSSDTAEMSPSTLPVMVRKPVVLCPMISTISFRDIEGWLLLLLVAVGVGAEVAVGEAVAVGVAVGDGSAVGVGAAVGGGSGVGVDVGADVG